MFLYTIPQNINLPNYNSNSKVLKFWNSTNLSSSVKRKVPEFINTINKPLILAKK